MIFIHSSFRTSSTHVWSRIRQDDRAIAYYEIFNEGLVDLSRDKIIHAAQGAWHSKHPDGAPYFLEYLPFLKDEGGVTGFETSFSYERSIPRDGPQGAISAPESDYVHQLIHHAESHGRIPVLTETRTLGRVAGLKAAAPGLHILLYRNLFQQWCSYTEQSSDGNQFFMNSIPAIARANLHDPVVRDLFAMFPVETATGDDQNTFYLFLFLHLYFYAHAAAAADVVMDINRVADDPEYRREMENVFSGQNLTVELSNSIKSIYYSNVEFRSFAEMSERVKVINQVIVNTVPSETGRQFADKVVSDFLEEYERHEFYVKSVRSVLHRALSAHEATRSEKAAAILERDVQWGHRQIELAALKEIEQAHATSMSDMQAALHERNDQRDAALAAREEAEQARALALGQAEAARRERDDVCRQRDAALAAWEEAEQARNSNLSQVEAAHRERDDLRGQRDAALAAREEAEQAQASALEQAEAVHRERDDLRAQRDAALAAREEAEGVRASALEQAEAANQERDAALALRAEAERALTVARAQTEAANRERDDLRVRLDAMSAVREEAERTRDLALSQGEAIFRERDDLRMQRDTGLAALDRADRAHEAALAEAEAVGRERDDLRMQRDTGHAALEQADRAHKAALAEAEAVGRERDDLRTQRDAAHDAGEEGLRAYQALEVRYALLLQWAVAYQNSTSASLGWRLTRPLRWLGIGRPVRPQKPDFL